MLRNKFRFEIQIVNDCHWELRCNLFSPTMNTLFIASFPSYYSWSEPDGARALPVI